MKNLKKSHLSSKVLVAALLIVLSISLLTPVYAVSSTTSGLTTAGFDRNLGKYLSVGGFEIYCFDNKLVFYTAAAVTSKTWDVPIHWTPYTGASVAVTMAAVNASHIVVTEVYTRNLAATYTLMCEKYVINVNSLANTYTAVELGDNQGISEDGTCFFGGSAFFVVVGLNSTDRVLIGKFASVDAATATTDYVSHSDAGLYGSTMYTVTADNSTAYVFGLASAGDRMNLFVCTLGTLNIASAGDTGGSNTYGLNFNFFGGYIEHNGYFDALFSFGYDAGGTEALILELVRFNATYCDVLASIGHSVASTIGDLHIIGVSSLELFAFNALVDGTYLTIYYNNAGALRYSSFVLADLDTLTPDLTGNSVNISFQGLVFHFGGSTQAGGLIDPFSTIALMVDFTGSRCAAELVTPLVTEITYTDSWSVAPTYWSGTPTSGAQVIAQLAGGLSYYYYGHIDVNGVNGAGYVNVYLNSSMALVKSASLDAFGNFSVTFNTPTQSSENLYYVSITLTNFNGNFNFYLDVLTMSSSVPTPQPSGWVPGGPGWVPGTTSNPEGIGGFIEAGNISGVIGSFINFMLLFIFIAAPAIGLGYKLGIPGLLGGGMFGLVAGVLIGLIPVWFIFITAAGLVLSFMMWRGTNGKQ